MEDNIKQKISYKKGYQKALDDIYKITKEKEKDKAILENSVIDTLAIVNTLRPKDSM